MNYDLKAYESTSTLGLSQIDLILKVYDGAITAFKEASQLYSKNDLNAGYEKMEHAKKFITHLYTTLDPEKGGEVAERLGKIYAFVLNQTDVAQATKDLKIIDDNISVLDNLRQGWQGLKDQQNNGVVDSAPDDSNNGKPDFIRSA
jgi:flagellar protein FliS